MTIDEIIAKLEARRDHGPYLHELVYQMALAFREELKAYRESRVSAPIAATDPSIRLTFELSQEPELPNQWVGRCVELDVFSASMSPLRALEATAEAVRMIVDNYMDSVNSCLIKGSELTVVAAIAALAEITSQ